MVKKLPIWGKIIYGVGAGGFSLVDRVLITWLYYYYITSPMEGVDALMAPLVFSFIMFFGRVVDAVADPVIARFSDNYSSRWGRRIPFMALSGILYVAVFIALFYPVVEGKSIWNAFYLLILLSFYFFLFTAYVCPYLALLPELARTNRDRVDLSTFKAVFSLLGVGIALIGGGVLIGILGFHGMIWAMGGMGLLMLYLPAVIREKDYSEAKPATLGLMDAIKTTLKNKAFLIFMGGNFAFWFGFNIVTLNIVLYVTSLLGRGEEETSLFLGIAFGVALLMFPLINILAKKLGLKVMTMVSLVFFSILLPLLFFLGQPVLGLEPLHFGLIIMGLTGIPLAGIFILPDAIVAAVSDLEEKLSGQRREAMYFGTNGLLLKLNLGLSTVVSGALLQFFGDPLGIQLTGPVAGLFSLIGLAVFAFYPEKSVMAFQRKD